MLFERLGMLDDDVVTPVRQELQWTDKDFPAYFINKQHPDDFKITTEPIEKELIFHEHQRRHPRLLHALLRQAS